ncbi:Vanillin dehydrogenase [Meyerozyma sp. JA9]|nr:Vanillin dehydrogenase [Meyerozyma sp. JA9]
MSLRKFKLLNVVPSIVNGVSKTDGKLCNVLGPKNHKPIHSMSTIDVGETANVCRISKLGFQKWSKMDTSERKIIMSRASDILVENRDIIVDAQVQVGIEEKFAGFNVKLAADTIKDYASQIDAQPGNLLNSASTDIALAVNQPIGPVLSMAPWNAPVILATRSIAAPLAAGCSVIFKTSEKAPLVGYFVAAAFLEAGVPKETIQLVNSEPEETPQLVESFISNHHIRKINYTGSTAVGSSIAQVAGKHLKPVLLELGGKNCSIVEPDAEIEKAVATILPSAWANSGQICMCTDKIYVHEDKYDAFLSEAGRVAEKIGTESHLRTIPATSSAIALVEDALKNGAKVEFGSLTKLSSTEENVPFAPLILSNVSKSANLYSAETFAPIVSIHKYTDIAKVVEEVNDSSYGLKASVWSSNAVRAYKIASELESGAVHINSSTIHDEPGVPHGGVKNSGIGRFNNSWGIQEFQVCKVITLNAG